MPVPQQRNEKKHASRAKAPGQAYRGVPLRDSGVEYGRLPLREGIPASNPRHPLGNVGLIPLAEDIQVENDFDDFDSELEEFYSFD